MAMVRHKNPKADLRRTTKHRYRISTVLTLLFLGLVTVLVPEFEITAAAPQAPQSLLQYEQIPETRQRFTKPPSRPAVPIETESVDVPDDVTIESTDLNFDTPIVAPIAKGDRFEEVEEDILEFYAVEEKPIQLECPAPVFPEMARRAGITGRVFVSFIVDAEGSTSEVEAIKGPEIFRAAAVASVEKCRFTPAKQNGEPVSVRMTVGIRFDLGN